MLSPTVAALPSDNRDRDMSMLHSLYGWGVLSVVIFSTLFLKLFGNAHWMILTLIWAAFPLVSCVMFCTSPMPEMDLSAQNDSAESAKKKNFGLALCVICIFLGSAAENAMTNWISGYMETALHMPKVVGDILGMAAFAMVLVLARTLYAKYGKNITAVLLYSMMGAVVCYLVAALSPIVAVSMIACVLTGFATSMLWPGTLILMEEKIPNPGVTAYALMAAGGDSGASVAPQLLGIITDRVAASDWAAQLSANLSITPDEIGMKVGMIIASIFPLLGIGVILYIKKYFSHANTH
jgi:fucose permease